MLKHRPYLHKLISGLIYPAMLGTYIVFFIQKYLNNPDGWGVLRRVDYQFSLLLISYFSVSYLVTESHSKTTIYNILAFFFDVGETFLMFFCFHALGMGAAGKINIQVFYGYAIFIPVLQLFWNLAMRERHIFFYVLDVLGILIFSFSYLVGFYYLKQDDYRSYNYKITMVISIIIICYAGYLWFNETLLWEKSNRERKD